MKTAKKTQGTAAKKTTAVTSSIGTIASASATTQDATTLLKADHRKVEGLFQSYQQATGHEQKSSIALQVCKELIIHTKIEEEIFYPACREKNVEDDALDEAQVEHDGAKILITELMTDSPSDQYYDAKLKVLSEYIKHHVAEEENPKDGIFAKAQKAGVDMNALGQKLQARKTQLMEQGDVMSPPEPQSLHIFENFQESDMARQNERERDDNGRFMSDDDNRGRSRGYSSQNRYQGNDDNGRYSRERDENGRFVSDDDDDNRSRSYGSRGDYDDDRSSRGRDENGRFTGSNSDDDGRYARNRDDDGRFSSNYDDGYRGGSSNRGDNRGWYGDSEGHSRTAQQRGNYRSSSDRSRDDDGRYSSDRGNGGQSDDGRSNNDGRNGNSGDGRGWYGDSEGHSRAAQQRGNYRSSSSRSSRDDDSRRSSSSSNRGSNSQSGDGRGWYGDSRGHAAAARRGWEDR